MRLTPAMAAISLMRVFRGALSDFFTMAETPLSNFNSFYKIPRPAKKSSFISPENNFSCQGILRQATLQRPWCRRVASAAFQLRKSAVHSRKSPAGDAMHCSGCSRTFGARPAAAETPPGERTRGSTHSIPQGEKASRISSNGVCRISKFRRRHHSERKFSVN